MCLSRFEFRQDPVSIDNVFLGALHGHELLLALLHLVRKCVEGLSQLSLTLLVAIELSLELVCVSFELVKARDCILNFCLQIGDLRLILV